LERQVESPITVIVADAFDTAAELALAVGDPASAAAFLTVASEMRASTRRVATPLVRRRAERATGAARTALGRAAYEDLAISWRTVPTGAVVRHAIEYLDNLSTQPTLESGGGDSIKLTPRQRDVLALLVEGRTDPQIGEALGISDRTVETHVSAILNRFGAHTRTAAVAFAIRNRLVEIP
jgi:DNA-binding CsgD family transcriptional regulator